MIPRFVDKLIKGEKPIIYGDGKQSRDFTYIANVVQANLLACLARDEDAGEVFNVACGSNISILEMYEMINHILGKDIEPEFTSQRKGDLKYTKANIEKIKEKLSYCPEYEFEEGLKKYLKWYQQKI